MTRHVFEIDVWPVFTGGHLQCQNKEFLSKTKIHCNLLHSAGAAVCKFSQVMVHTENWFTESVIRRKQLKNIYFYERVMAFPGWVVVFNGCWFEHNSIIDARPGNCSSRQFSGAVAVAVKPRALFFLLLALTELIQLEWVHWVLSLLTCHGKVKGSNQWLYFPNWAYGTTIAFYFQGRIHYWRAKRDWLNVMISWTQSWRMKNFGDGLTLLLIALLLAAQSVECCDCWPHSTFFASLIEFLAYYAIKTLSLKC